MGTKKVAAEWVKNHYGSQWKKLIEAAEQWEYGKEICLKAEAIEFIKFVIEEVKKTMLFKKMLD